MNKINVFILAAGLGERLRPITDHIPKPLIPILGKPVLHTVIEKVSSLPLKNICINLHHEKEMIENWINQSDVGEKITLFREEPILDTGGALKNAEPLLSSSTFLVHNSDVISDIDLEALLEAHLSSKNLVTLAVHNFPEFNSLAIDENGFLKGVGKSQKLGPGTVEWSTFTGIAVYEPGFLNLLPSGKSSVVSAWLRALKSGYRVGTYDASGCYWSDVGTPASYASAVFDLLRADGETVFIHPSVKDCRDVYMNGFVVVEGGSTLEQGVTLGNCIILPESRAESNREYKNCILGPSFKIDLNEPVGMGLPADGDVRLIGVGGSERKFYRVKRYEKTAVLMQSAPGDEDFDRQIEYTRFFLNHSIPVPDLIEVEPDRKVAIFEDLGDISLYSWLKCPRASADIEKMYKKVIDVLVLIHTLATEHLSECPLLQKRVFDYGHFRWETDYFVKRFVQGVSNISVKDSSALEEEFHRLALKADSFPKTVVHRDFQSQNIMIASGELPRIIDYQSARVGPPSYDVVSILWDPYYRLKDSMREGLINYYIRKVKDRVGGSFDDRAFGESLLTCRLQRHMQALGAYGFLSAVKKKKYFLRYVPQGLRLLKEDLSFAHREYPELYDLVMGLDEKRCRP